jgi:hypothetical protein
VLALKTSEGASARKKVCNTDIDEEVTGFEGTPDSLALPGARWCGSFGSPLCCISSWAVSLKLDLFLILGTCGMKVSCMLF